MQRDTDQPAFARRVDRQLHEGLQQQLAGLEHAQRAALLGDEQSPVGACASAVARLSPVMKLSSFVKPLGTELLLSKRTVAVVHADTLPAVSCARTRTMCWPAA